MITIVSTPNGYAIQRDGSTVASPTFATRDDAATYAARVDSLWGALRPDGRQRASIELEDLLATAAVYDAAMTAYMEGRTTRDDVQRAGAQYRAARRRWVLRDDATGDLPAPLPPQPATLIRR